MQTSTGPVRPAATVCREGVVRSMSTQSVTRFAFACVAGAVLASVPAVAQESAAAVAERAHAACVADLRALQDEWQVAQNQLNQLAHEAAAIRDDLAALGKMDASLAREEHALSNLLTVCMQEQSELADEVAELSTRRGSETLSRVWTSTAADLQRKSAELDAKKAECARLDGEVRSIRARRATVDARVGILIRDLRANELNTSSVRDRQPTRGLIVAKEDECARLAAEKSRAEPAWADKSSTSGAQSSPGTAVTPPPGAKPAAPRPPTPPVPDDCEEDTLLCQK